jgi:hypothetical protein
MQIGSTIKKLLSQCTPEQLLRHVAYEVEQQAAHYQTIGAPMRAQYGTNQVKVIRDAAKVLDKLVYPTPVPKS